jgi:hypothetical protein
MNSRRSATMASSSSPPVKSNDQTPARSARTASLPGRSERVRGRRGDPMTSSRRVAGGDGLDMPRRG